MENSVNIKAVAIATCIQQHQCVSVEFLRQSLFHEGCKVSWSHTIFIYLVEHHTFNSSRPG